ncbi:unnamed protein product, partial [Brenthis ino]
MIHCIADCAMNHAFSLTPTRVCITHASVTLNDSFSIFSSLPKRNDYDTTNRKENIILSYQIGKGKRPYKSVVRNVKSYADPKTTRNLSLSEKKCTKASFKAIFDLKSFTEYDYDYTVNDDLSLILREEINQVKNLNSNIPNKLNNTEINKTPYAKFYNLEPAIAKINIKTKYNKSLDNNIWYVPQEFPCWELPIIYGELGERKKKSDVFLIYGGKLVNVIDHWTKKETAYKAGDPPMSHVSNKWCGVQPCYGDHTLCLFPNNDNSNICHKKYKVHVPTILDHITITNTINSMRNRVAHRLVNKYSHLPTAANMKQINYDYDLEKIAEAWLRQCLPGAAPCSAIDGQIVSQLECSKYMQYCCLKKSEAITQCTPRPECFVHPVIGCIHVWFSSAGKDLTVTDIQCGRTTVNTFNTVQLLWAETRKIGCAYGEQSNGDIRVICEFSPGAPFYLETKLFCGIINHKDISYMRNNKNLTDLNFLSSLGIKWNHIPITEKSFINISIQRGLKMNNGELTTETLQTTDSSWGLDSLTKVYKEGWVREHLDNGVNGTRSMIARLVAKYTFIDESESRCDSGEPIYEVGSPGSSCIENGRTYTGLCYDFGDPTPGYRVIAIAAPIALFSLMLYDLFSGVVRQTNY